jgi:hypothetical protein
LKKAIILTDLRIIPLLTACFLSTKQNDSQIIFSEYSIESFDYGYIFPSWYNKFKIFVVSLFFNIKILPLENTYVVPEGEELVSIFSSLVSITTDSLADSNKYPKLYDKLLLSYNSAISIRNFLAELDSLSEIFVFNGRTASSEPIVRYFFHKNVKLFFYEYPAVFSSSYTLYDFPIHDNYKYGEELYSFYKKKYPVEGVLDSSSYISNKLNNKFTQFYHSKSIDKFDIVIFLGSDHELIFLNKEINNNIVFTNLELIDNTINRFGKNYTYAVRAHPNQRNDPSSDFTLQEIENYCKDNGIKFFTPDSDISSYDLINNCQIVVVGYSSIAEDAIYLQKKVVFMGNSDISAVVNQFPIVISGNPVLLKENVGNVLMLRTQFLHNEFPFLYRIVYHLIFRIDILIIKFFKYEY